MAQRKTFSLLCVLAAVLLTAVAAAPALATEFKATKYPADISGTVTAAKATVEGKTLSMECKSGALTGNLAPGGGPEAEVWPTFSECTVLGIAGTIKTEGCAFRGNAASAEAELSCHAANKIVITAATCEVQLTPGTGVLSGVSYATSGSPQQIAVESNFEGVTYNKTKDGFLCPLLGTGEKSDGTLELDATLKGLVGGTPVGLFTE